MLTKWGENVGQNLDTNIEALQSIWKINRVIIINESKIVVILETCTRLN